jgi:hypothetical protein
VAYVWTDSRQGAGLSPELNLACAVIGQALKDTKSSKADVRAEALAFLHDPAALGWWNALLDLTDGTLQQRITQVLRVDR